ncbi:MAG: hypothetical protein KJN68_02450, partial [Bacteroidia bacterium]|nr:hypothetical protein [Bacteroidia bacterium]
MNGIFSFSGKLRLAILLFLLVIFSCRKTNDLPDPLEAGWKNKSICEVMEDNDKMRILKCTFEPNEGHERHYHKPHFAYALHGSRFRLKDTTGIREVDFFSGSHYFSQGVV